MFIIFQMHVTLRFEVILLSKIVAALMLFARIPAFFRVCVDWVKEVSSSEHYHVTMPSMYPNSPGSVRFNSRSNVGVFSIFQMKVVMALAPYVSI